MTDLLQRGWVDVSNPSARLTRTNKNIRPKGAGLDDSASTNHAGLRTPLDEAVLPTTSHTRHQGAAMMSLVNGHRPMLVTPAIVLRTERRQR